MDVCGICDSTHEKRFIQINDLEEDKPIFIKGVKKVNSRSGDRLLMEIEGNLKLYLPENLSENFFNDELSFKILQDEITHGYMRFRILSKNKELEFVTYDE